MRHVLGSTVPGSTRPIRLLALAAAVLAAFALPWVRVASATTRAQSVTAFVPQGLLSAAQADPGRTFSVVVQGTAGSGSAAVANDVVAAPV